MIIQNNTNTLLVVGRVLPVSKKHHQNQEVFSVKGISPTIKATSYKDPPKIQCEDKLFSTKSKAYKGADKLNTNWKLVNFCEIDKYAVKSYCAVHNIDESINLGDITKIDTSDMNDFTMMCGGSPCQDFSLAGNQKGSVWTCTDCGHEYNPLEVHWSKRNICPVCSSENIEKTRSSLLVEYLRVLREKHPKFALYENVKNIIGKKFRPTFDLFIKELREYGYNTYYKVLNAKDYGVPQNRERVYIFIVDKSLDNGKFEFPQPFDNGIRLKDILEDEVEEKYYLSEKMVSGFIKHNSNHETKGTGFIWKPRDMSGVASTLRANAALCPTDNTVETCILSNYGQKYEHKIDTANSILARDYKGFGNQQQNGIIENSEENIRIRKLTPKECWRLMGFSDNDFNLAHTAGVSNSQLYKQAGNSIVTDVLLHIYNSIYDAMPYLFDDLTLTSLFSGIGAFEIALDRFFEQHNENFTQPQQE